MCIQQHQNVTADSELRNSDDGKMQHSLSDSGKAVEKRHTSQTGKSSRGRDDSSARSRKASERERQRPGPSSYTTRKERGSVAADKRRGGLCYR